MPSVEISKLHGIGPARALSESDRSQAAPQSASPAAGSSAKLGLAVEVGSVSAIGSATPPVDTDRVEQIRAALRDGSYPLVPTKIVDAMIAAQVSFSVLPKDGK
ncbi:flagellar biosynthesis anti-sigma factor FlgM [Erythrobacter sp. T5W1-R]|uniref:flagellar biosynthesis anti-sigma factor FlgM n=1 Tax=Erythrobacter sp. T5W1-R TaxID=3101752 RepID=UPI002AFE852A|nr:flagellar biosynthesis anti-sigma factor FlgM [Erythrobacter sp. T5W1-R]MEA1619139.1 flagellar biosynthesis anti-sigma factor FlgM [Erythrobacter sp. T5W1-R]